jgi:hypothetical protein
VDDQATLLAAARILDDVAPMPPLELRGGLQRAYADDGEETFEMLPVEGDPVMYQPSWINEVVGSWRPDGDLPSDDAVRSLTE